MRVFAYDLNHNFDLSGNCVLRFKCPVPDYAEEAKFYRVGDIGLREAKDRALRYALEH